MEKAPPKLIPAPEETKVDSVLEEETMNAGRSLHGAGAAAASGQANQKKEGRIKRFFKKIEKFCAGGDANNPEYEADGRVRPRSAPRSESFKQKRLDKAEEEK